MAVCAPALSYKEKKFHCRLLILCVDIDFSIAAGGRPVKNSEVSGKSVAQNYAFGCFHAFSCLWPSRSPHMSGILSAIGRVDPPLEGGPSCLRLWAFHRSLSRLSPVAKL